MIIDAFPAVGPPICGCYASIATKSKIKMIIQLKLNIHTIKLNIHTNYSSIEQAYKCIIYNISVSS